MKAYKCEFVNKTTKEIMCRMKFQAINWEAAVSYVEKFTSMPDISFMENTRWELKVIDKI